MQDHAKEMNFIDELVKINQNIETNVQILEKYQESISDLKKTKNNVSKLTLLKEFLEKIGDIEESLSSKPSLIVKLENDMNKKFLALEDRIKELEARSSQFEKTSMEQEKIMQVLISDLNGRYELENKRKLAIQQKINEEKAEFEAIGSKILNQDHYKLLKQWILEALDCSDVEFKRIYNCTGSTFEAPDFCKNCYELERL